MFGRDPAFQSAPGVFEVPAGLLDRVVGVQHAKTNDGDHGQTQAQNTHSEKVGQRNFGISTSLMQSDHSQSEADKRQEESAHFPSPPDYPQRCAPAGPRVQHTKAQELTTLSSAEDAVNQKSLNYAEGSFLSRSIRPTRRASSQISRLRPDSRRAYSRTSASVSASMV
jgi:hypothetical protein